MQKIRLMAGLFMFCITTALLILTPKAVGVMDNEQKILLFLMCLMGYSGSFLYLSIYKNHMK